MRTKSMVGFGRIQHRKLWDTIKRSWVWALIFGIRPEESVCSPFSDAAAALGKGISPNVWNWIKNTKTQSHFRNENIKLIFSPDQQSRESEESFLFVIYYHFRRICRICRIGKKTTRTKRKVHVRSDPRQGAPETMKIVFPVWIVKMNSVGCVIKKSHRTSP